MFIRQCREDDLATLEKHYPSPGRNRYHEGRFQRQRQGMSTFLVVWLDEDTPVGSGEIRWHGCAAPEVRARYPDCPELNGLAVWPAERRSQGIGTALIQAMEERVRVRGCDSVGLGVGDDNARAAALYGRLGYEDVGLPYLDRYAYVDDSGVRHDVADPCRFLVKRLIP